MGAIHQTETAWKGGLAFETVVNGHAILMDDGVEGGGQNLGPRPKPLLLSALTGCSGIDVVSILNKMRVEYSNLNVDARAEMTDEHPKVYKSIHMVYKIKIGEADHDKMEKAVRLSQDKYCGVVAMLSKVCPVTWEIQYL